MARLSSADYHLFMSNTCTYILHLNSFANKFLYTDITAFRIFLTYIWTLNSEVYFLGYRPARLDRGMREVSLDGSGLVFNFVHIWSWSLKGLQSFNLHTIECLRKNILIRRLESAQAVLLHYTPASKKCMTACWVTWRFSSANKYDRKKCVRTVPKRNKSIVK